MSTARKYQSPEDMRKALEERLNRMSKEQGVEIMRIRRHVAFDRLLARILTKNTEGIVLKGGYALELWMGNARTTKDIDLSFNGTLRGTPDNQTELDPVTVQELLQDQVSINTNDFMVFTIGNSILDLENALYGGYRYPVEVKMAGRLFIKFEIDFAAGDLWIEPHEMVKTHDWFDFAGISAPMIPVISKEQQFAEKIHAYTLPRKTENSRVKDLVDLLLLITDGSMKQEVLIEVMRKTFTRRKTHPLPDILPIPPQLWKIPFNKLAKSSGLTEDISQSFEIIQQFYRELRK